MFGILSGESYEKVNHVYYDHTEESDEQLPKRERLINMLNHPKPIPIYEYLELYEFPRTWVKTNGRFAWGPYWKRQFSWQPNPIYHHYRQGDRVTSDEEALEARHVLTNVIYKGTPLSQKMTYGFYSRLRFNRRITDKRLIYAIMKIDQLTWRWLRNPAHPEIVDNDSLHAWTRGERNSTRKGRGNVVLLQFRYSNANSQVIVSPLRVFQ